MSKVKESQASSCFLCASPLPPEPLAGITPNPDSFLRLVKLLSSSKGKGCCCISLLEPVDLDPGKFAFLTSLSHNDDIMFCFVCHDKLIELNEAYAELDKVLAQLSKLREGFKDQLLIANSTVDDQSLDPSALRARIIKELGLGKRSRIVTVELPPGVNSVELEIKHEPEGAEPEASSPIAFDFHEDPLDEDLTIFQPPENPPPPPPPSNIDLGLDIRPPQVQPQPRFPKLRDIRKHNIKGRHDIVKTIKNSKCSVVLEHRIDQLIPIPINQQGNDSEGIIIPKELIKKKLPWTKYRAVTTDIYEGITYPASCRFENCESTSRFQSSSQLRRHIVEVHVRKRFVPKFKKQCPVPGCTITKYFTGFKAYKQHVRKCHRKYIQTNRAPKKKKQTYFWKPSPKMKLEAESFDYPLHNCPHSDCSTTATSSSNITTFQDMDSFVEHFRRAHHPGRQSIRLDPEMRPFLREIKKYPTKCPVPNCPTSKVKGELKMFPRRDCLTKHLLKIHNQNYDKTTESMISPDYELSQKLKGIKTPTLCPVPNCPSKLEFQDRVELFLHFRRLHNIYWEVPKLFPCTKPGCKQNFEFRSELNAHLRNEHNPPVALIPTSFPCPHCDQVYSLNWKLTQHIKINHNNQGPASTQNKPKNISQQCHLCGENLANTVNLELHLLRHAGKSKFPCRATGCTKGFLLSNERKTHERDKHWEELGLEPMKCGICEKYFTKPALLKNHIDAHSGIYKFSCTMGHGCQYKTSNKKDMQEHQATVHMENSPFQCELCNKSYKLARQLKKHMIKHKGPDELAICDICNKPFNTTRLLRIHKERMHGVKTGVVMGSSVAGI